MSDLRARSFTVAQHITGEKRPVVFLHVAEAEVKRAEAEIERLREFIREFHGDAAIELLDAQAEIERLRAEVGKPQPCAACGTSKDQTKFCYAHDWMGST